jgi:hypothetical protein
MGGMKDQLGDKPFEQRPYPERPGFVAGSDTSRDAAKRSDNSAGAIRIKILNYIESTGSRGATCDEVEETMQLKHQTASARIRELVLDDKIIDTGLRRKTRSGSGARIYVPVEKVI